VFNVLATTKYITLSLAGLHFSTAVVCGDSFWVRNCCWIHDYVSFCGQQLVQCLFTFSAWKLQKNLMWILHYVWHVDLAANCPGVKQPDLNEPDTTW